MNVRQVMAEKERARRYWSGLSSFDRGALGDALVLGDFDWREWFDTKPSGSFLREVDELRILWEMESAG